MHAIVVENLTKQFPGEAHPAVDRVSFTVEEGAFVALLGPSGCGKTTLLKMINRLYEPTAGRIIISGQETRSLQATELRRRIGYAIQQTGLFPHMRVEQNIAVVPELLRWQRARIDARIDELLDLVGLPHSYRARYPRQLSGGEQQRVGLARALAADPAIMLMDEPFGALDPITRARLQDELADIQSKLRKTIVFVTHDVEEALRLADTILVMRAGALVQEGNPLQLLTQPHDSFVRKLIGSDDMLRRLSLIPVSAVLARRTSNLQQRPGDEANVATLVRPHDNLRSVLGLLLRSGASELNVVNDADASIGRVAFDDLRSIMRVDPATQA
jgi:osmoprotectant transport system ATP-binding protein